MHHDAALLPARVRELERRPPLRGGESFQQRRDAVVVVVAGQLQRARALLVHAGELLREHALRRVAGQVLVVLRVLRRDDTHVLVDDVLAVLAAEPLVPQVAHHRAEPPRQVRAELVHR